MKKKQLLLSIIFILAGVYFIAQENSYAMDVILRNSINKIKIEESTPYHNERYLSSEYLPMSENEVRFISHYINSLEKIKLERKFGPPTDSRRLCVEGTYADGTSYRFILYPSLLHIIKPNIEGYTILPQEYYRLCEILKGLDIKQIILPENITFEPSEWAKADVEKAISNDLVPQWNQINYTGNINRVEVCQLVENFIKNSGYDGTKVENPFTDTNDVSVTALYSAGIINGKSETEFCPYDFITREELAKVLSNMCHLLKADKDITLVAAYYQDQEEISGWALDSVNNMTSLGIFIGNESGEFEPQRNITKEEVVVILQRLMEY